MEGTTHVSQFTEQPDLCLYVPPDEQPSTEITTDQSHRFLDHDHTGSTHGDAHALVQDCGYNSSASSTERSSGDFLREDLDYEELRGVNSRASSRSSISSIPASVFTSSMDGMKSAAVRGSHEDTLSHDWDDPNGKEHGELDEHLRLEPTMRKEHIAFRKTSSVRAMQMHTEDEADSEFLTPPKRRGHRMSEGSSPIKRSPYYSPSGLIAKQKAKKELPLVLLHCNLLPPSLPIPGLVHYPDQKVLKEILPPEYWRRWKLLEEKIGSVVLRERGVLISHPEDMYDLLEERLLESLELQRPRLDHGHFLGHEEVDTDRDDQSMTEESATDDEQGEQCPDCGGRVVRHSNTGRKWEIRVFAANGLMRAGAWAAAWKGMEKVDVEVGLWLPSGVRRELEKRLSEGDMSHVGNRLQVPQLQEVVVAMGSTAHDHPYHSENLTSPNGAPKLLTAQKEERSSLPSPKKTIPQEHLKRDRPVYSQSPTAEIELQTLLVNYIRVLASDRRNVAICLLSILVIFCGVNIRPTAAASQLQPFPPEMLDTVPQPAMSPMQQSPAVWASPTSSVNGGLESSEVRIASVSSAHQHTFQVTSSQTATSYSASSESTEALEKDLANPDISSDGTPPKETASVNPEAASEKNSISMRPIDLSEYSVLLELTAGPVGFTNLVDPMAEPFSNDDQGLKTSLMV
ncbi:hypothetical protein BBP40_010770 [Aspergillus hancockii]|nr:hypothetical protein BBP40_010770 [Aspergillus hancockii]